MNLNLVSMLNGDECAEIGTYTLPSSNDVNGTLKSTVSKGTSEVRNYNLTLSGSIKIVKRSIDPDVDTIRIIVHDKEYDATPQQPDVEV